MPPPEGGVPTPELRSVQLVPYVYEALRRCDDARAAELRADVLASAFIGTTLDATAASVGTLLETAGIPHVFIKGAAMRRVLADVVPARTVSDVDLLVAARSFGAVARVLVEGGFRPARLARPLHQRLFYEQCYLGDSSGLTVLLDVHRHLVPWPLLPHAARQIVADRLRLGDLWVPKPVDSVVVTAVHQAKEAVRDDVRDAFDALLTIHRLEPAQRASLAERCESLGCLGALYLLMLRVEALCGEIDSMEEVKREVARRMSPEHLRRIAELLHEKRAVEGRSATARGLLGDVRRHALVFDGPVRATLATGRMVAALSVDHAVLRVRRLWRREPGPG